MKFKFNLDDDLPLKKAIKFYDITVLRFVFNDSSNYYYSQVFLHAYLYKLDTSGIDVRA